jgi:AraC-like DNA-binding protein
MNLLFDPVYFDGKPLLWGNRTRSTGNFEGFYHWHQCCEILLIHEGEGTVIVNQNTYELKDGMLFFFQPFELHKIYANVSPDTPYERTLMHFDPVVMEYNLRAYPNRHSFFNLLWQGRTLERAYDLAENLKFAANVCDMYEKARGSGKGDSQEEISLLMLQLLTYIQAAYPEGQSPDMPSIEHRPFKYSETIMNWLEAHYAEAFDLEELADELHLSKFYVSRVFRQETGSSITEYLQARRIKQACRLLQTTDMPVERIGFEVGLPNVSYFIQLFKKVVGATPLKYRNNS